MVHRASDGAEARWNYAFWLQNEPATVGGPLDPDGERLITASFDAAGLRFADDDYSDEALAIGDEMTRRFVDVCVKAAQRMYEEEAVSTTLGRPIPSLGDAVQLDQFDAVRLGVGHGDVVDVADGVGVLGVVADVREQEQSVVEPALGRQGEQGVALDPRHRRQR